MTGCPRKSDSITFWSGVDGSSKSGAMVPAGSGVSRCGGEVSVMRVEHVDESARPILPPHGPPRDSTSANDCVATAIAGRLRAGVAHDRPLPQGREDRRAPAQAATDAHLEPASQR